MVATTFIIGGFIILWAERRQASAARIQEVEDMRWQDALKVGLVQCLAMIPGTSRSGATIIGGMLLGMSRKAATDFSFYLAIPTLIGAGAYSLYKERALLSMADAPMFAVGLLFSFLSAWVCVRWLLQIHLDPQLCRVRLVPNCFWSGGAGHQRHRLGALERLIRPRGCAARPRWRLQWRVVFPSETGGSHPSS